MALTGLYRPSPSNASAGKPAGAFFKETVRTPKVVLSQAFRLSSIIALAVSINILLFAFVFRLISNEQAPPQYTDLTTVQLIHLEHEQEPIKEPEPVLAQAPALPKAVGSQSPKITAQQESLPTPPAPELPPPELDLSPLPEKQQIPRIKKAKPAREPTSVATVTPVSSHSRIGAGQGASGNGRLGKVGSGAGGPAVTRKASPAYRVSPQYPPHALQARIEGIVTVEFLITRNGAVSKPRVREAIPPGVFDEAALDAIAKWRYDPKIVDGTPIEHLARQDIYFRLKR
jgi:protein TonB